MLSAKRIVVAVIALLVLASPAAANEQRPQPRGARSVERVRIVDNRFRPRSLTIERGTVVRWVNRGSNNHTTTSDSDVWDSGTLAPDESFRRRFRRAGTFAYHCTIHPRMTATITVT